MCDAVVCDGEGRDYLCTFGVAVGHDPGLVTIAFSEQVADDLFGGCYTPVEAEGLCVGVREGVVCDELLWMEAFGIVGCADGVAEWGAGFGEDDVVVVLLCGVFELFVIGIVGCAEAFAFDVDAKRETSATVYFYEEWCLFVEVGGVEEEFDVTKDFIL